MKLNQDSVYILFSLLLISITSCTKTDDYKKFYEGKELVYPGRASKIKAYPGNKRIKLSWMVTDAKVTGYKVYWDNRSDSLSGNVTAGTDPINVIINNLTEGPHSFKIFTFDKHGRSSVAADTVGSVYGDSYQLALTNRLVRSSSLYKGTATIEWYGAPAQTALTEIKYTDISNVERKVKVDSASTVVELPDFKQGASIQYRTAYLPDTAAIDTFYTAYKSNTPTPVQALRLSTGKVYTVSSRPADAGRAFDGNQTTFWSATTAALPQWVQVDLGKDYDLSLVKTQFHERTNNIYNYKIEVSNDGTAWRPLVPQGGRQGFINVYAVFEHPVNERGRYVRITFSGSSAGHWSTIAEFEIWGN